MSDYYICNAIRIVLGVTCLIARHFGIILPMNVIAILTIAIACGMLYCVILVIIIFSLACSMLYGIIKEVHR